MNPNFPPELAAHLSKSVRAARRRYRKRLAECQGRFSEKAVHRLRTETRRILALLDLLETLRFEEPLQELRKSFKKRLDVFDHLRDTHVQRILLKPLWPDFPEARELKKHLRKCEQQLEAKLSRKIQTTKYRKLDRCLKQIQKSLRHCADNSTAKGSNDAALTVLDGAFRRVLVLRRQIKRSQPATIHRMRVAFKRFRYTAEFLKPFFPQMTLQRLTQMKEFQEAAGTIQDLAVLLARLVQDVKNGKLTPACVSNLRGELVRRERRAIESLMRKIEELEEFNPEDALLFAAKPQIT